MWSDPSSNMEYNLFNRVNWMSVYGNAGLGIDKCDKDLCLMVNVCSFNEKWF